MTRIKKKYRLTAALLALMLVLGGCVQRVEPNASDVSAELSSEVSADVSSDVTSEVSSEEVSSEEVSSEPELPDTVTLTLTAVGDNLIHRPIYQQAYARGEGETYDFTDTYAHVADKIAAADIAVYNQETLVAPDFEPSSYPRFNSPRELGEHMVNIGFDVASLANNHTYDKGESGLRNTLEFWQTQEIVTTGAFLSKADSLKIPTVEHEGITFGFVAFTDPDNMLSLPQGSKLVVLQQERLEEITDRVRLASLLCDIVVVLPHWGQEYTTKYSDSQHYIAQVLADSGADLIIGSHSHCLQPIETVTSSDGREVPVCYSLGNFISGQTERMRLVGGMVDFVITVDRETKAFTFDDIDFRPVITHYTGNTRNICNYLYADYTEALAQEHGVVGVSDAGKRMSFAYIDDLVTSTIDQEYLADDWRPASEEE